MLSKIGTEKVPELIHPYLYLTKYLYVHDNLSDLIIDQIELNELAREYIKEKDNTFKNNIKNLIRFADLGIEDLIAIERNVKDFKFPKSVSEKEQERIISDNKYQLKFTHPIFDNGKQIGKEDFEIGNESNGTKKFLVVSNLILDALNDGSTIIIDELDKSLHPLLTRVIIYLFNNPNININNGQLIFATQDVSLLDSKIFRRDQILFTDKDSSGMSTISL